MAAKATIYKADLQVADIDRNYYAGHALTLARHASETDERMMMRLLAFALHADPELTFAKGMTDGDEPDLWQKDLTGLIDLWIDVGQPDEQRIRKACGRAREVIVYSYSGRSADIWWRQLAPKLERLDNLRVLNLPATSSQAVAALARRNMQLQCTIQDGQVLLVEQDATVAVELDVFKGRVGGVARAVRPP